MTTLDRPEGKSLTTVHLLLLVQSLVIILISVNRLSSLTLGYVAPNEFMRWVDFNNMLPLPILSVLAYYLLKQTLVQNSPKQQTTGYRLLDLALILGIYLFAAGYGNHEITNYLHIRFCLEGPLDPASDLYRDLCRIIIFNDDEFSHWVFFAGFLLINAALMLIQAHIPWRGPITARDNLFLIINGIFIGLGLVANLAFEVIGIDLYIVALIALLAVYLFWRYGRQPILTYYTTAYLFGLIVTAIIQFFSF